MPAPPILLAWGFRPFFLAAGVWGVVAVTAWIAALAGHSVLPESLPPALWHGHEMLFGFVGAAVAGFLLTAVPNWTGTPAVVGRPLGIAVGAWLLGRAGFWFADALPAWLVAGADVAFLPILAVLAGRPILASGNRRNLPFPVLIAAMAAGNIMVHAEIMGAAETAWPGTLLAAYAVAAMLALVGGRIGPNFTMNALRARGIDADAAPVPWIERSWGPVMALTATADMLGLGAMAGAGALALGVLFALRMRRWRTLDTLKEPIVWVLHLGHGWLAAAFLIIGLAGLVEGLEPRTVMHALFIGAFATMILAVMTRAALGHTGRPLKVAAIIVPAYGLVGVAAVLRVFLPWAAPDGTAFWIEAAGVAWIAAFAIYVAVYFPILTRPRVDGRPG